MIWSLDMNGYESIEVNGAKGKSCAGLWSDSWREPEDLYLRLYRALQITIHRPFGTLATSYQRRSLRSLDVLELLGQQSLPSCLQQWLSWREASWRPLRTTLPSDIAHSRRKCPCLCTSPARQRGWKIWMNETFLNFKRLCFCFSVKVDFGFDFGPSYEGHSISPQTHLRLPRHSKTTIDYLDIRSILNLDVLLVLLLCIASQPVSQSHCPGALSAQPVL